MLKLKATGLSLPKIVKDLANEYQVSARAVYMDWANRKRWLKTILGLKDPERFFLDLLSKHDEIYKLAVLEFLKGDNSNARVGALRLLREVNKDLYEMVVAQDILLRLDQLEEKIGETTT